MMKKLLSVLLTLCLAVGMAPVAQADTSADFEALIPLMDVICAASQTSPNAPESVPGADGELTVSFVDAFMKVAAQYGGDLGVTASTLADPDAQAEWLGKVFAAQVPQLQPVTGALELEGYIGFQPVTVNNGTDGSSVQIIGEMYKAAKPISQMTDADQSSLTWIDRAVFILQYDQSALKGFRINGFSVGTDLAFEEAMMGYDEAITIEYESKLGFMLLYPSIFTDESLVEDENGVSATLADGSASFFAKRMDNENGASLADYVSIIANGITDSVSNVNQEMQYGTVTYTTDEGYVVFDVFIVTDAYIYQAEFTYQASRVSDYGMYTFYLENSFVANELAQG